MGLKICADCRMEMTCFKNGVAADYGQGACHAGDLYICPGCGSKLLFCNEEQHIDPEHKFHDYFMPMAHGYIDAVRNPFRLRANRCLEEWKVKHKQEPVKISVPLRPTMEEIVEWHQTNKKGVLHDKETVQQSPESEEGGDQQGSLHQNDPGTEREQEGSSSNDKPDVGSKQERKGSRYTRSVDRESGE